MRRTGSLLLLLCALAALLACAAGAEGNACFNHLTLCARSCSNAGCVLRMCGATMKTCACDELRDVLQIQLHYVTDAVAHARHDCFSA